MNIENKVNGFLNRIPILKKLIKRIYQYFMYLISPKIKSEGNIYRVTPNDGKEYFFGYYDKSPWDISDRYMLCLRVNDTTKSVAPSSEAEIVLIDTKNGDKIEVLGKTKTWNVQQGAMLQWLGPSFDEEIIYNDYRNGKYCSIKLNIKTKDETIFDMPIYSVAKNGKFALTLDFSRLHRLRPGYGYSNEKDQTLGQKVPVGPCIWKLDLKTNEIEPIMKYSDFINFEPREEMVDAEHKVNHIMLNPSDNRFMVLHRWSIGGRKFTRLITVNVDGTDMYNLSDDNMTSHCTWKNDWEILGYLRKEREGNGYFLLQDKTQEYQHRFPKLTNDGHPSYSHNQNMIITDTYPDRKRLSSIILIKNKDSEVIARVFSPFKYDNDLRCDLHPRWNRNSTEISFDATFEGKRNLYKINLKR